MDTGSSGRPPNCGTDYHSVLGGSIRESAEPLTSFVGRERELVELKRLLSKNRLLSLVGAGGIGKTRLALQLAAEVKGAYRDGVWLIDFAPLYHPELVANVAAQTLGVRQSAGKSLVEALCRQVKGQRLLMIFDNCEHVLDAAARLAEAMLRGASEPTIIATSRERLRIGGEQIIGCPRSRCPILRQTLNRSGNRKRCCCSSIVRSISNPNSR